MKQVVQPPPVTQGFYPMPAPMMAMRPAGVFPMAPAGMFPMIPGALFPGAVPGLGYPMVSPYAVQAQLLALQQQRQHHPP
jgi:hypothetical protein